MAAATLPNIGINRIEANILDRTVCITLQLGKIGIRKKVSTSMIDVPIDGAKGETRPLPLDPNCDVEPEKPKPSVDKSLLSASKQLIDSKEFQAIRKLDSRIREYVYEKCLPYRVGIFLLPIELVARVEDQLVAFRTEREELVEKFLIAYPEQIRAAEARLLILFNDRDYKTVSEVRQAFTFEWQYVSFGTPGKLRDISPEFFRQEQEKAARKWEEAGEAIQQVLRVQMRDLVDKLREKLAPPDGAPRVLRKENVENMREFIDTFDIRNVTSDAELKALVERAKSILGNAQVDDMRTDEQLRSQIADGFGSIKKDLDCIVAPGATRAISFED